MHRGAGEDILCFHCIQYWTRTCVILYTLYTHMQQPASDVNLTGMIDVRSPEIKWISLAVELYKIRSHPFRAGSAVENLSEWLRSGAQASLVA